MNNEFLTAYQELFARGEWDEIIRLCDEELARKQPDQDKFAIYYLRNHAYSQKGESGQTMEDFFEEIASDDDKANYNRNRGIVHFGKGEYDEAIAAFTQAIAMTSDNKKAIRLWHELGYVLSKRRV